MRVHITTALSALILSAIVTTGTWADTISVLDDRISFTPPTNIKEQDLPDSGIPEITVRAWTSLSGQLVTLSAFPFTLLPLPGSPATCGAQDANCLTPLIHSMNAQFKKNQPNFKVIDEKHLTFGPFSAQQIDTTNETATGEKIENTFLYFASGKNILSINIITPEKQAARHRTLVKQITDGIKAK